MIVLKNTAYLIVFVFGVYTINAQESSIHDKINLDMYDNFSKAYKTSDYNLFASIHSKEMIRVSGDGGSIKKVDQYLKGYQKRWSVPKKNPPSIDFRLLERVHSDSLVSDRGIYKVTYTSEDNQTTYSYGKFHVILKLEDGNWKIALDYDSNENKSITKTSFDNAFTLSEYSKYCKN